MEPLHPAVVHLPLGLAAICPLLFAALTLAMRRGWLPRRSWFICIALQALVVSSAWFAMEAGEDEEERVEQIVRKQLIHEHEERAEAFLWAASITLVLSASVLLAGERAVAAAAVATAATVVALVLAYRTGISGGELVYRHGAASAYTTSE